MKAGRNETVREKPLSRGAKGLLMIGVGLSMLAFYAFALLAILFLAVLILAELVLLLALARFGASRLMVPFMEKHTRVLGLLLKSLRLQKGVEFRIALPQADAPALHEMLQRLCGRLELAFPHEVTLQMGDVAWVQLKGFRSGAGKVTLGVGYDLLAGLSVAEMEAVLAHEMTHAKLISRGYRNWLWGAQSRVRKLAMSLWGEINNSRRNNKTSNVAQTLFSVVDRLLRLCTRLIATYSRQDEFEADRGAAELCGGAVMKSALSKLESLHCITSRLPWNERVAQLQRPGGYSQWLLQEIAQGAPAQAEDASEVFFNKYSTHPSIPDRLLALPDDGCAPAADSPSAIRLLAHPDNIAVKLLSELQRLMADQEKKDSRALEKLSRKTGRLAHLGPMQGAGFLLILGGVIAGLVCLVSRDTLMGEPFCLVAIALGVIGFRLGRYRDRLALPVPAYEVMINPARGQPAGENVPEKEKFLQKELRERFRHERAGTAAAALAKESYSALQTCDYLRAHVAARECLRFDKKSVEGAIALAVACAAFNQIPNTAQLLAFVQRRSGFKTFSTAWGAAWAAMLAGDWIRAEAMLDKALKLQPQQTALISYLALAQSRRGKLQSAIGNARRACDASPESTGKLKFLIARLLDGGFTREAQERMRRVSTDLQTDPELMFAMAQYELLQRRFNEADQWTGRLKQAGVSAQVLVRLGHLYETARLGDGAAALYQEALAAGHYPEAHLGLGRIETERKHKPEARRHILAALNIDLTVGKEGVTPWQLLHPILTQMLWLEEPLPNCRAWTVAFRGNGRPAVLAGQSFMVFAPDLPQAREYVQTILRALHPEKPPEILPEHNWTPAPRPMQPDGPVRPGVQGLWQ
jgi:Zn-dependent protease with chaperone function/Tfp pilus assembly protein PilF